MVYRWTCTCNRLNACLPIPPHLGLPGCFFSAAGNKFLRILSYDIEKTVAKYPELTHYP